MFTGIVEEPGTVAERDDSKLRIAAIAVVGDAAIGDSIAVNGCCLTVVALGDGTPGLGGARKTWDADVTAETYSRTSLGDLSAGDPVNLERPVRLADRLGGHLVQGHVDGVGTVVEAAPDLLVRIPDDLRRYVVEKGSIAIDGVSLTVVASDASGVRLAIIPHTAAVTTLGTRRAGDRVNIEVDIVAKYVESLLTWKA